MKNIVLLSTDTPHHRYFINELKRNGYTFKAIIFESTSVKAPFETKPFFENEENEYEKEHFFRQVSSDISSEKIFVVKNINDQESINLIEKIKPDLGLVFGTRKLTKQIISLFKDGLFNVHRGIAQKYRGLDSDLWAIYHNDIENIGVTIHKVDYELDTGAVVYQAAVELKKGVEIFHLRYLTTVRATELIIDALKDYFENNLQLYKQEKVGRYYSFMPLCIKQTLPQKFKKIVYGK